MIPIPNLFFIVLNAILTGYLTFLTTKGGLTDNRFSTFWRRLTRRGWSVLFILISILLTLVLQEINNDYSKYRNELKLNKERNERDSIITIGIKKGVDLNRKKLFEDLSEAFAKQELRLDTVKNSLEVLRDSVKVVVNNYSSGDPVIMLERNGISPDLESKGTYKISFKSVDQGSTNFNIKSYVLIELKGGQLDLTKMNFFPKGLTLAKNATWTTGFGSSQFSEVNYMFIHITGSYTNLDASKAYRIDEMYKYTYSTNSVSIVHSSERRKALLIIRSIPDKQLIIRD